jgi:hypothetical protein
MELQDNTQYVWTQNSGGIWANKYIMQKIIRILREKTSFEAG